MAKPMYQETFRIRTEASFNAPLPGAIGDWNTDGVNGLNDLPVTQDSSPLQSKTAQIYPSAKSGRSSMNSIPNVPGRRDPALGGLEIVVFPELMDPIFMNMFGQKTTVETPGVAALTGAAWPSSDPLTTEPAGTEQLSFEITSATAITGASITITQNGILLETITLQDDVSPPSPFTVYSKGAYDGAVDTVDIAFVGTVTAATVDITGIQFVTTTYKKPTDISIIPPTLVIQQIGRVEAGVGAGKGAEFFTGVNLPTLSMAFDATAADNLLMASVDVVGVHPTINDPVPYVNSAAKFYKAIPTWNGVFKIDVGAGLVDYCELTAGEFSLNSNNAMDQTQCTTQNPTGFTPGLMESTGTMSALPSDDARFLDYEAGQSRPAQMLFQSASFIHGSTFWSFAINFGTWTIEDYTPTHQAPAQAFDLSYRSIENEEDQGPASIVVVSRRP